MSKKLAITISFKKTRDDLILYNIIESLVFDKSTILKDLIWQNKSIDDVISKETRDAIEENVDFEIKELIEKKISKKNKKHNKNKKEIINIDNENLRDDSENKVISSKDNLVINAENFERFKELVKLYDSKAENVSFKGFKITDKENEISVKETVLNEETPDFAMRALSTNVDFLNISLEDDE